MLKTYYSLLSSKLKVIVITGPTATGKTALACKLAKEFNGEIISADSRQVYKKMDIGTGKDISEYNLENKQIPYHLIDIVDPNTEYNLRQFNIDAYEKITEIASRGKIPIITGGTPLYIDSLISSYEFPLAPPNTELRNKLKSLSSEELSSYVQKNYPKEFESLENKLSRPRLIRILENIIGNKTNKKIQNPIEIKCDYLILGTFFTREEIHQKIEKRLDERLKHGMIEEVQKLHEDGISWEHLHSFGLEYRYVSMYLQNILSFEQMRNTLLAKIRKFARTQDVWFRKMERSGHLIYWVKNADFLIAKNLVSDFLEEKPLKLPEIILKDILRS